ncbi:replicative DNA helicase [Microvirga lupini]|uniref:Replicative DNA helicase n=1 Tax=Microvirga lupini TaxID=420324 RepID=A0A7W4VLM4_9HYPH|nr:DNA helicase [Microvirga lupini]MBB3018872.1 replicative DNA helicase [Microvirga lupini]
MKLSAPIYLLKRRAKRLAREQDIPLNEALDRIALQEGCKTWSLLASRHAAITPVGKLFGRLAPGDLVLIGARPGQGKTLMSLELAVEAMRSGSRSVFFTLEYTEKDIRDRFRTIGWDLDHFDGLFSFDCSDTINADHIMRTLTSAPRGTLAVVDYLQLLDQKRENPPLADQVRALKTFALGRELVIVFVSQIDRSYDPSKKPYPDMHDIRLPNPLDLELFSKACFLNNGKLRVEAVS